MIILDFCSFSVRSGRAIDGFDFFFYQNFFQGRLRNTKAAHDFLKKFFRNENPKCGGKGGTPGWTAPIFNKERKPGKEDMYSVGWLILKLLCDDKDLFLCLRDNFVADTSKPWMAKFRNLPEIQILLKMINIENQPTVETIIDEWNKIKSGVSLIQRSNLLSLGVPQEYLQLQYYHLE